MYVDVKVTVWQKIQIDDSESSVEEIIEFLERYGPSELWNDIYNRFSPDWETLLDTEEYMTVEENDGCSTIELYEEYSDGDKLIWNNGIVDSYKNKEL